MARPLKFTVGFVVRLSSDIAARLVATLRRGEYKADFVRAAVEREIQAREAESETAVAFDPHVTGDSRNKNGDLA